MSRLIVLVFAIAILTACGLKGPLYLPVKSGAVVVTPATPASTTVDGTSSSSSSSSSTSSSSSAN